MLSQTTLLLVAVAVLVFGQMVALAPVSAAPPETERVIVQMVSPGETSAFAADAVRGGGNIRHVYSRVLDGFAADLPPQAIEALRRNPRVESVTSDVATSIEETQQNPPWGLDRTDQRAGLDSSYSYDTTGAGVTVYVVDSGVRFSHAEFEGRARSGYDFVDFDADASDCNGHGTHVAGTIGGKTYGVAKDVSMVSLRVWGCQNTGWMSDMIAAFDWAVADRSGPAVINLSGSGGAYAPMDEATARATAAGVVVVAAASNNSADACGWSPARAPSAITVGGTDSADSRASFSNYGACVDLFAPGVSVLSSTMDSDTASGFMSGTSMATPHVAGAAARHLQSSPSASVAQVSDAITTQATQGIVTNALSAQNNLLHLAPPNDNVPPTVTTFVPVPSATDVSESADVQATFSEPVVGISTSTLQLYDGNGVLVPATVGYNTSLNRAWLNPSADLAPNTFYMAHLVGGSSAIRDAQGAPLSTTSWTFTTAASANPAPTVTVFNPTSGTEDASASADVQAKFSEPVVGISTSTFQLYDGNGVLVPATVGYNTSLNRAWLNPNANLAPNTVYVASLTGGSSAIRDVQNAPLSTTTWSFKTAANTAPTVTGRAPAVGATAMLAGANVTATFSKAVQGVSGTTFTLENPAGTRVSAAVSYNSTSRVATLNPGSNLAPDTWYTATLTGGSSAIRDLAGAPLATTSWTFLTGPRPLVSGRTPAVGATGVARGTNVTATFNERVQGVSGTSVQLRDPSGALVSAAVTYSATSRVATLNPGVTLVSGTRYSVTLTGSPAAIRDMAGNPLANVTWSFTTGSGL